MPLINFRTNLKSLRYGADRPGGGSSDQPYIQFPIEDADTPPQFRRYYESNRTALDFPLRGGAITNLLGGVSGIISSTIDRERIQKFFNSAPRGTAFINKQKGLQLSNPKIQVPNSLTFLDTSTVNNVFLPVTNIYEPTNTLAQVQVMGTGAHFNRHGFAPTIFQSPQRTYAYIVGNPENNTEFKNRLAILKTLKLGTGTNTGIDATLVDRMGISPLQDQLFNYTGGPGSVYGIGFTRIARNVDTRTAELLYNSTVGFTVNGNPRPGNVEKPYTTVALTYQQLSQQATRYSEAVPTRIRVQDFRRYTNENSNLKEEPGPVIASTNYWNYNIEKPYGGNPTPRNPSGSWGLGIGSPGTPRVRMKYTDPDEPADRGERGIGEDLLNITDPLREELYYNPSESGKDPWTTVGSYSKDIIKFAFECIDNNNPSFTLPLIFRAFLEGQITDNNTAEYNTFKYLGRGETFRTYQGFDRVVTFAFKVFVQSRREMQPLYRKLNQLISQVYPDYSPTYNLMRGNVVTLTIGDYLYRVPGFLDNVNVTIDNNTTPWEIVLDLYKDGENEVRQLPHMVSVQCSFRPIFNILPRKVGYNSRFVPLIANKDRYLDPDSTTVEEQKTPYLPLSTPIT